MNRLRHVVAELLADPRPDIVVGVRRLLSRPGFTLLVIGFLALGIGATVTTFSLVETVLLRSLPYDHADRLARLYSSHPENGWDRFGISVEDFEDWRAQSERFDALEAYHYTESTVLLGEGDRRSAERVRSLLVTPTLFDTVGAKAALGRTFAGEEGSAGGDGVVVLSHAYWRRALGGDRGVVGDTLRIDGQELVIVGVMPEDFFLPAPEIAFWRPLVLELQASGRGARFLQALGRLAPDADFEQASAELETVASRLEREHPETNEGWTATMVPARDWIVGDSRGVVLLLWAAVGTVLLIVCANVAGLLMARCEGRRAEMSTRVALGAGRVRLVRQVLVESLVLSAAGGLIGTLLGVVVLRLLPSIPGVELPRLGELALRPLSVAFAVLLVLLSALAFGVLPALRLSGSRFASLRTRTLGDRSLVASGMVVVQIGLAVVLLVSSGLLLASLRSLLAVEPGIAADSLLSLRVATMEPDPEIGEAFSAGDRERALELFRAARAGAVGYAEEAVARLEGLPEVKSAAAVNRAPLAGAWWITELEIEGLEEDDAADRSAYYRAVTPGYFETAGIELVRGRLFDDADHTGAAPVIVIDESLAHAHFGDADPIGARIGVADPVEEPPTVIGVVASVHQRSLEEPAEPTVYLPLRHAFQGFGGDWAMTFLVRTRVEPAAAADSVRRELQAMRPEVPIEDLAPMAETVSAGSAARRLAGAVLSAFALSALAVAALGVFALTLERVQRGAPALGLRVALGARPADLVALVIRRALVLAGIGLTVGVAASRLLAPTLRSQLYGVEATDPRVYGAVVGLLGLAALAACGVPAWRALRIDPARALTAD